jgi:hypothetical protein
MKKFMLLSAVVAALALAAGRAVAASNGTFTLTMSGTVETVKTSTGTTQTTQTKSFNNATIYLAISNAVAQGNVTGVPATNLPAKGFIVYNPEESDGFVQGIFYVTTKGATNFAYPLSGMDTNGNYYSYMELDTTTNVNNPTPLGFDLGPDNGGPDDFNSVASFNTTSGAVTASSTAIFYAHADPYAFDAADVYAFVDFGGFGISGATSINSPNPAPTVINSQFALEAQGILTITENKNSASGAFSGTSGNALIGGNQGLVKSGKVTVK